MRYAWAIKDIESELQGAAFWRKFKFTTTIDFTGKKVKMQVRKSNGDEEVILTFDSDDAATMIVDETEKTVELMQVGTVMQEVRGGEYDYDIKIYTDGNDGIFLQKGKFIIGDTTTR